MPKPCKVIECTYFIQHHLMLFNRFIFLVLLVLLIPFSITKKNIFDVLFGNDVWERFNSLLRKHSHSFMQSNILIRKFQILILSPCGGMIKKKPFASDVICITICHLLLYDASHRKVHSLYFINKFISNRRFSLYLHLIYIIIE